MTDPIQCFWLEPTSSGRIELRRYRGSEEGNACPLPHGYHDASVLIGVEPFDAHASCSGYGRCISPKDDPRWPTHCGCGYAFAPDDMWREGIDRIYRRGDTGAEHTLKDAPVGAMWDAPWYDGKGPDGRALVVKTPAGDWLPDHPSRDGKPWQRSGDPTQPASLSITPSIGFYERDHTTFKYHAFLTAGVLVPC